MNNHPFFWFSEFYLAGCFYPPFFPLFSMPVDTMPLHSLFISQRLKYFLPFATLQRWSALMPHSGTTESHPAMTQKWRPPTPLRPLTHTTNRTRRAPSTRMACGTRPPLTATAEARRFLMHEAHPLRVQGFPGAEVVTGDAGALVDLFC